ncbi:glycosyltransferase [Pediococcus pentosaceus]|uniref:Glycosyltransferase n=1 Tax=Pediococcus pentosaceus (strain ATCC 25745 / CCUG 21536 / LMG 10740 / 183-1w) TaxID=278197 RepID=Q03GL4_PEDPA|nr:glycosyltransferase [Pediococcus pentosaceus]ABJ67658.1 Glycosyltransferase [Pediococcus pentosaceus ATCC 25745]QHM64805.1 Putative glycosyltransferase EpsF [Pediococcus pentosaceus]QHM66524.1 Putative glycosyltransferase EpsF [Pediococcus pentosaceus]QHM69322.1 Putative glycosyltransferase EpsF [Pediococcus pentosaceus]
MKKILVVGDFIKGSGLTNYLLNIYSSLPKDEFLISCVSYSGQHNIDTVLEEKKWEKFEVTPITQDIIKHFKDWNNFFKLHGNDFDEIHFNYSAPWNFIAILLAKLKSKAKIIVQSHNNYYSKQPKGLQKKVLAVLNVTGRTVIGRCSDIRLAVSEDSAQWMFGKRNVQILKNGINLKDFEYQPGPREELRKSIGINKGKKIIGFVGTLEKRKNPYFAIECLKKLNKEYILLMFGQGVLKKDLEKKIMDEGLEHRIKLMGVVDNLNEWYSVFDLFLFPSLTEGFGFALLEAQANGLKCFSSTSIPKEAKITNDVTSLNLSEINKWIDEIEKTSINDRERRSKQNCRIIEKKGFSIENTSKQFKRILLGDLS